MKIRTAIKLLGFAIVAMAATLQAATYYSQGTSYLTAGANWNTARDGSGTAGFSTTYRSAANDLVMQTNLVAYFNSSTASYDSFDGNSYTVEDGVVLKNRDSAATHYASFNGGDITVASGATLTIQNSTTVGAGNSAGGFNGSASLVLASGTTLVLDQSSSSSSGDFEFGLDVVGGGAIDLDYANANCNWYLSGLSSSFTGVIRGDTFNGSVRLAAGDGAMNADVVISRSNQDKTCTLDLDSTFSVGTLTMDGVNVTTGIYTYAELVAFGSANSANFSDNLIDNGGTLYIGQTIFVPKVTYYSQSGSLYPPDGAAWNQERSGADTNLNGYSTTYAYTNNNIVIQDGQTFWYNNATTAFDDWNANSYTVEGDVSFKQRDNIDAISFATFNNGDITVDGGGILRVLNANSTYPIGTIVGGFTGSAKLNLPSGTILNLDSSSSVSSGELQWDLEIVGDGDIDFEYANATTAFYLSGLTSNYTGRILGDTFNGQVRFAAGNGAINAEVQIGRSQLDKTCKLNLDADFSVGVLKIDGVVVSAGVYTVTDLVAANATYADNLIDNGGTVYIGQDAPPPPVGPTEDPTIISSVSGGELIMSWDDGYTYNVLTNADLLNGNGWGTAASGVASPVTNTIGSETKLFYKLEFE